MITDEQFIETTLDSCTMNEARIKLNLNRITFKQRAEKLGVYNPNAGGKGKTKDFIPIIPLREILEGKRPKFQTNKLRIRLIKEGIKEEKCEECGIDSWRGKKISLELNHIDGNKENHTLSNLEIICPNCHSQTSTYRGRNIKKK